MQDFTSRTQMLAYVENRVIIDVDKLAKLMMRAGDIFRPDSVGIYHELTGECIVDFGKGYYSVERTSSIGSRHKSHKHYIVDYDSFIQAPGDIYSHQGFKTLTHENIKRIPIADERPLFFKAKYAAAALVSKVINQQHDYFIEALSIPQWEDLVDTELLEDYPIYRDRILDIERIIYQDNLELLDQCRWKELYYHRKSSVFMIDVLLDIRIKDYYERKFQELEALQRQQDEDMYEGRIIQCT